MYKYVIYYSWFNVKIVINESFMESYVLGFYVKSNINIGVGQMMIC